MRTWRKWLAQNQNALFCCGLPEIVLTDESHWQDFLLHGYLDHHFDDSNFAVENLSPQKKSNLLQFLENELTEEDKQSAVTYKLLKTNEER